MMIKFPMAMLWNLCQVCTSCSRSSYLPLILNAPPPHKLSTLPAIVMHAFHLPPIFPRRRYQEAKEREWRAKEKAAAERATALQRELAGAREAQKAAKLTQRAEMARVEHDEFMRVLAVNRAKEEEELTQQAASLQIHERYKEELLAQVGGGLLLSLRYCTIGGKRTGGTSVCASVSPGLRRPPPQTQATHTNQLKHESRQRPTLRLARRHLLNHSHQRMHHPHHSKQQCTAHTRSPPHAPGRVTSRRTQIASNEERRARERQAYLEEGRRLREAADEEKRRLADIKARKLSELTEVGVPAKYRAELEKYRVGAH